MTQQRDRRAPVIPAFFDISFKEALRYTAALQLSASSINMWFKNLIIYQLEQLPESDHQTLGQALETHRFKHCGPQDASAIGWASPFGDQSDELVLTGSNYCLFSARFEQRLLPATVVREALNEKVQEIETNEARKIGRKQKSEMKDELIFSMTPKAFTRSNRINGLIMLNEKLLVIDSASRPRAEDWLTLLRESLGGLEATPLEFNQSISATLTGWLTGKIPLPSMLQLGDDCLLQSPDDEKSKVRLQRHDLGGSEVRAHLDAGKYATRLQLHWQESLGFTINHNAEFKRLVFEDSFTDQAAMDGGDDTAAEIDAIVALMSLELARLFPVLFETFGGSVVDSRS